MRLLAQYLWTVYYKFKCNLKPVSNIFRNYHFWNKVESSLFLAFFLICMQREQVNVSWLSWWQEETLQISHSSCTALKIRINFVKLNETLPGVEAICVFHRSSQNMLFVLPERFRVFLPCKFSLCFNCLHHDDAHTWIADTWQLSKWCTLPTAPEF